MHPLERRTTIRVISSGLAAAITAVSAAIALLSGSCFLDAETKVCAASGLRCPLGYACSADQLSCIQGGCGDGIVSGDEVCDDGNVFGGDGCSADCLSDESCGNGTLDPGESCDDGRNDDGDACSATCVLAACGNGSVDLNEQCDPGTPDTNTATCDRDCSFIECGDGLTNVAAGEECDIPNRENSATCNGPTCKLSICGDSFFNSMAGEECDTGVDTQACNGAVAGNNDPAAFCKIPRCGDRYANLAFTLPVLMVKEQCDSGGIDAVDCDRDCTAPVCGDGLTNVAAGEQCDDGNMINTDACVRNAMGICQTARCGDGFVRAGVEACDDGNSNTDDNCPSGPSGTCQVATCGDGFINAAAGDICDPGSGSIPQAGCVGMTCVSMGASRCKQCI